MAEVASKEVDLTPAAAEQPPPSEPTADAAEKVSSEPQAPPPAAAPGGATPSPLDQSAEPTAAAAPTAAPTAAAPTAAPTAAAAAPTAEAPVTSPGAAAEPLKAPKPPPSDTAPVGNGVKSSTVGGDAAQPKSPGDQGEPTLTAAQESVVQELRVLQKEHDEFEREYLKEWNALKLKYFKKFKPLYGQRHQILCSDPPKDTVTEEDINGGTRRLPSFWHTAMKKNDILADRIAPHDEPVLRYLEDIRSDWLDETHQTSFRLTFVFTQNPYFENENLTKTFLMDNDESDEDEEGQGVMTSIEGTDIKWKHGKDVTKVTITKKQRNSKTKRTRVIQELSDRDSFFNFFNSVEFPSADQFDKMKDDDARKLEDDVEAEYDLGCVFREKIIPHALGWFMGEETDDFSESDSSNDDSDSDSHDDEEDDDDDDDDMWNRGR